MSAAGRATTVWCAAIVEELVRQGVGLFAVAPGSRSTPLVAAIAGQAARGRVRAVVLTDERVAAFVALGWGRATGRPAAVVTTSGTAPAQAFGAVLEAEADGVPLLVLSADRAPEARESGANQTLDQVRLFGGHVRWAHDFAAPDEGVPLEAVVGLVGHGVRRSLDPAGPVQLNFMFRKPLEPVAGAEAPAGLWPRAGEPRVRWSRPTRGLAAEDRAAFGALVAGARRGVLLVGGLGGEREVRAARALAERLGWPTYADLASGLRLGAQAPVVPLFEALLGDAGFAAEAAPDVVVQVGGRIVSGRIEGWLAGARPREHVRVRVDPARDDVAGTVSWRLEADVEALVEAVEARESDPRVGSWRARSAALEAEVDAGRGGVARAEAHLARAVSKALPAGGALFAGNSMPIRDWDRWAVSEGEAATVGANRGASGIDGLVSTAVGFALGLGRATVAVVGDQSFVHDVGGLAALAVAAPALSVIVVNNAGGHIFDHLPVAQHPALLGPYFTAPHAWRLDAACAAFGLPHRALESAEALVEALQEPSAGPRVLEIRV